MRTISADLVYSAISDLIAKTVRVLPNDVLLALDQAQKDESHPQAKEILAQLLQNAAYAKAENLPLCQDTGLAVFFVEHGEDVRLSGAGLHETLTRAVVTAYGAYLRKSMCHPFSRVNTGNNTPISLHIEMKPGDMLKIGFLPKGGGADNMSRCAMLPPSAGKQGIIDFILQTVAEAGSNPCPPIIAGIGIGGSFDQAPIAAKKMLLREIGTQSPDPEAAELEQTLLAALNNLNIGPGGLGGHTTCLAVFVDIQPCHIASLPVAVNIQCNSVRRGVIEF